MPAATVLSLPEHLVLGLIAEHPTHGFALAQLTGTDGPVGRVYRVPRPVVYRAVERLTAAGLVRAARVEPGSRGPQRTLLTVTAAGRRALKRWLSEPVPHVRNIRTEFMTKLALLERAGVRPESLVAAQRSVLLPVVAALAQQHRIADGFDRTLAAWRYQTADATLRFLDHLSDNGDLGDLGVFPKP